MSLKAAVAALSADFAGLNAGPVEAVKDLSTAALRFILNPAVSPRALYMNIACRRMIAVLCTAHKPCCMQLGS